MICHVFLCLKFASRILFYVLHLLVDNKDLFLISKKITILKSIFNIKKFGNNVKIW